MPAPTRLEVAFTPALLREPERKVCVVIDVLRMTSSAVAMFGRGLAELLVVAGVAQARRLAGPRRRALLCGEAGGLPPKGFDYGNSPSEFARLDLAGRRAILATTNGSPALVRAATAPAVLLGALLNATAVARAALAAAGEYEIALVCAGNAGRFALEDAFCAGAIAEAIIRQASAVQPSGSALAARRLYRSYRGSARAAFWEAEVGRGLARLGFGDDLALCARHDRIAVVPGVASVRGGVVRVVA